MPELAPIETRPPQGSCPTAEDLACYIDGALSPEEAARITKHLASCESCFEVYSEVVRFQLESEGGDVVPFPTSRWQKAAESRWMMSSLAALLLIGLGGFGIYRYLLAPPAPLATAELAAPVQGMTGLADNLWRGVVNRGGPGNSTLGNELPPDTAAFRAGVQIVNLQLSLRTDDGPATVGSVIPALLDALKDQPGTGELQESYRMITISIEKGKENGKPTPRALLPEASRLATESREYFDSFSFYLDLGQWVEAGRLAAISHDPAFFRLPESRSFLRHALWRDRLGFKDSKLPERSRAELYEIGRILDKGAPQPGDYPKLLIHFNKVLAAEYPD